MKRLLALIGLTYLSVLAVVFYLDNRVFIFILSCVAAVMALAFVFIKIKRHTKLSIIVGCVSVICACASFVLYSDYVYQPIIDSYADKEITVEGYICDEIEQYNNKFLYTLKTDSVNGEDEKIKIHITAFEELDCEEFDRVKATFCARSTGTWGYKSDGIFLSAYANDDFTLENLGEKQNSPYYYAVKVRKAMKSSLDSLMDEESASLCKAVLLSDKYALSDEIYACFSKTGSSFIIVVSGMHLSIIAGLVLFIVKRFKKNRFVICLSISATVIFYMALTGFTPSVVRSGVMLIMTYCAAVLLRKSDSLNSMGLAALILTLQNPFAAGDVGLLLSFSATAGIILWSGSISTYFTKKLKIKFKPLRRFLIWLIRVTAVSFSASVWVMPLTIIFFGRITPLVVIISVLNEPFVTALVICALFASLLYICPYISFLAYPFAFVCKFCSKYIIFIEKLFASIPFCSVNVNEIYVYIWLAISVLLVIIGFLVKSKSVYIKYSALFSCCFLALGWAVYTLYSFNTVSVTVKSVNNGVTAVVENSERSSLVSCGGSVRKAGYLIDDFDSEYTGFDYLVVPNKQSRYSSYLPYLINEFDVSTFLVYDNDSDSKKLLSDSGADNRFLIRDNTSFTLNLSEKVSCEVLCVDGATYEYLSGGEKSLLFITEKADIADIPEKYRQADYVLLDRIPENAELLSCDCLIFSGTEYMFNKYNISLREICSHVTSTTEGDVTIILN